MNLRPLGYERWVLDDQSRRWTVVERRPCSSANGDIGQRPPVSSSGHADDVDHRLTASRGSLGSEGGSNQVGIRRSFRPQQQQHHHCHLNLQPAPAAHSCSNKGQARDSPNSADVARHPHPCPGEHGAVLRSWTIPVEGHRRSTNPLRVRQLTTDPRETAVARVRPAQIAGCRAFHAPLIGIRGGGSGHRAITRRAAQTNRGQSSRGSGSSWASSPAPSSRSSASSRSKVSSSPSSSPSSASVSRSDDTPSRSRLASAWSASSNDATPSFCPPRSSLVTPPVSHAS